MLNTKGIATAALRGFRRISSSANIVVMASIIAIAWTTREPQKNQPQQFP